MLYFLLLVQICFHLCLKEHFLLGCVIGIITLERRDMCVFELEYGIGYLVEEITVVGDYKYGSVICTQISLEPDDGIHIEMVCGLVEYDKVRLFDKYRTECSTGLLAAGESGSFSVEILLGKSQTL